MLSHLFGAASPSLCFLLFWVMNLRPCLCSSISAVVIAYLTRAIIPLSMLAVAGFLSYTQDYHE
jgi:hypothetical protein